jgi:hypothetical protein
MTPENERWEMPDWEWEGTPLETWRTRAYGSRERAERAEIKLEAQRVEIERLKARLTQAVGCHINITSAYRTGGTPSGKALDGMIAIRKEVGL